MGSPFTSADEFTGATGAFHSFTNSPTLTTIFLVLSGLITLYFLYRSFTLH